MFLVFLLVLLTYASLSKASMSYPLSSSFGVITANVVSTLIYAILSLVSIFFTQGLAARFDMPIL